ncbi:MAG: hypothetical protein LBQ00_01845 [Syntrophobacterales bacterium]|jgi:hypothetical protein|nr:hypothetical protein [Syntrophobacterales bacterium]
MSILADIKRLGFKLEDADKDEIDKILQRIGKQIKDKDVRNAIIEGEIGDFLNAWRPDIMDELVKDRQRQVNEWVKTTQRKYDEKGNRVCEEQFCPSTNGVTQCIYCGKFICKEHNYKKDSIVCYDCFAEKYGKENA